MVVRTRHGNIEISSADKYAEFMQEKTERVESSVDGLKNLLFLRGI